MTEEEQNLEVQKLKAKQAEEQNLKSQMTEEEKIAVQKIEEERIAKEKKSEPISIATRNLRLLKRLVLGKNKPPLFLRVLCWFNLGWSALMMTYYGLVGILVASEFIHDKDFDEIGSKYFFVYSILHITAFVGTILIWRMKKLGFYLYSIPTIVMPFLLLIMTWKWSDDMATRSSKFEIITLLFSVATIGLFALNWKSLNLFKKKEKEPKL